MNILNKKELTLTGDKQLCDNILRKLDDSQIKYKVKVENPDGFGMQRRSGGIGINTDRPVQYYIYVHRDDYEEARSLL